MKLLKLNTKLFLATLVILSISFQSVMAQTFVNWPCYSVSENNTEDNDLYSLDPNTGLWSYVGSTGTINIEAISYNPVNDVFYATNAGVFGELNTATGAFTAINTLGTINGGNGAHAIIDVDGLAYDPTRDVIWASDRVPGVTSDIIFQIDYNTGMAIPNAFGPGVDYLTIAAITSPTGALLGDIDDIAYDPYTNTLFAILNQSGAGDAIASINTTTGSTIVLTFLTANDMEGLGINYFGELFGTTGAASTPNFYYIDKTNGNITALGDIDPAMVNIDFESYDCFSAYNDLALTKVISASQPMPIQAGDVVTFTIEVFNQGSIPNSNIEITDFIPAGLTLADFNWAQAGSIATTSIAGPLQPGASQTVDISFTVDAGVIGEIVNFAEISYSEYNDGPNVVALGDIDSTPDATNSETNVDDNSTSGSGPVVGEDEDDNDPASIVVCAAPIDLGDDVVLCADDEYTITANPDMTTPCGANLTYAWTTGETTQSIVVTGSGIYGVTVTDCNGCTYYDEIEIEADACCQENFMAPPTGLSCTVDYNAGLVTLSWDEYPFASACLIQGGIVGQSGFTNIIVGNVNNPASPNSYQLPVSSLEYGVQYWWRLVCGCSVSPVIASPFSQVKNLQLSISAP